MRAREGDTGPGSDGGRARLGLIVKMPAASIIELGGHVGFRVALIDTEHGPNEMIELEHHIRAAASVGTRVLVRVSDAGSADILRALDAGANGIVVPHVGSREDVTRAVELTRYPPEGRRSLAVSTRAGRHGTRGLQEHLDATGSEVVLIGQLEDADALERLSEILDAPGLDGVFIGPADLSASLGQAGQVDHPDVRAAIDRVVDAVRARPGLTLCALAGDETEALDWIDRGASLVLLNASSVMAARLNTIAEALSPSLGLQEV